jgi:hypothetical protein
VISEGVENVDGRAEQHLPVLRGAESRYSLTGPELCSTIQIASQKGLPCICILRFLI